MYLLRSIGLGLLVLSSALTASAVPNDFDGDGLTDLLIANGASQQVKLSSNGAVSTVTVGSGSAQSMYAPGDYNGDGLTDFAVVEAEGNNLVWKITYSGSGATASVTFGAAGNTAIAGCDFDGDGRADLATLSTRTLSTKNIDDAEATTSQLPNTNYKHYSCFDANGSGGSELFAGYKGRVPGSRRKNLMYDAHTSAGSSVFTGSLVASTVSQLGLLSQSATLGAASAQSFGVTPKTNLLDRLVKKLLRAKKNFTLATLANGEGSKGSGVIMKLSNFYYSVLGTSVSPLNTSGFSGAGQATLIPSVNVADVGAQSNNDDDSSGGPGINKVCRGTRPWPGTRALWKPESDVSDPRGGKPVLLTQGSYATTKQKLKVYTVDGQRVGTVGYSGGGVRSINGGAQHHYSGCCGGSGFGPDGWHRKAKQLSGDGDVYVEVANGLCLGPIDPRGRNGGITG